MNPNDSRDFPDRERWMLVDRLAADELDDDSRRALFAWLDCEPIRWRRCATALLEAREWQGAMQDWFDESSLQHPAADLPRRQPAGNPQAFGPAAEGRTSHHHDHLDRPDVRNGSWNLPATVLAIAASLALAFGLGAAADRHWGALHGTEANRDVVAQAADNSGNALPVAPKAGEGDAKAAADSHGGKQLADGNERRHDVVTDAGHRSPKSDADSIPAYVKSQLERRGYQIDSRRQFVSVSLPDGRRVSAPVEFWNFRYVGNPVY